MRPGHLILFPLRLSAIGKTGLRQLWLSLRVLASQTKPVYNINIVAVNKNQSPTFDPHKRIKGPTLVHAWNMSRWKHIFQDAWVLVSIALRTIYWLLVCHPDTPCEPASLWKSTLQSIIPINPVVVAKPALTSFMKCRVLLYIEGPKRCARCQRFQRDFTRFHHEYRCALNLALLHWEFSDFKVRCTRFQWVADPSVAMLDKWMYRVYLFTGHLEEYWTDYYFLYHFFIIPEPCWKVP